MTTNGMREAVTTEPLPMGYLIEVESNGEYELCKVLNCDIDIPEDPVMRSELIKQLVRNLVSNTIFSMANIAKITGMPGEVIRKEFDKDMKRLQ